MGQGSLWQFGAKNFSLFDTMDELDALVSRLSGVRLPSPTRAAAAACAGCGPSSGSPQPPLASLESFPALSLLSLEDRLAVSRLLPAAVQEAAESDPSAAPLVLARLRSAVYLCASSEALAPEALFALSSPSLSLSSSTPSARLLAAPVARVLLVLLAALLEGGLIRSLLGCPSSPPLSSSPFDRCLQALVSLPDRAVALRAMAGPGGDGAAEAADARLTSAAVFAQLRTELVECVAAHAVLLPADDDEEEVSSSPSPSPSPPPLPSLVPFLDRIAAVTRKLCALAHADDLATDWTQAAYNRAGMGGALLLVEGWERLASPSPSPSPSISPPSRSRPTPAESRPEFPNAEAQFSRAAATGRAGASLLASNVPPGPARVRFLRGLLSSACGVALDFVAATPVGYRGVHPARAEAEFTRHALAVLLAAVGDAQSLAPSLRDVFARTLPLTCPLPGLLSRTLLLYLLFPRAAAVDLRARGAGPGGLREPPPPDLLLTRGAAASTPPLALAEWKALLPLPALASAWAAPAFTSTTDGALQLSLSRVLVHALLLAPPSAVDGSGGILETVMAGVQARLDASDDSIRGQGEAVAVALSHRLTPGAPLSFAESGGGDEGGDDASVLAALDSGDVTLASAFEKLRGGQGRDGALGMGEGEGGRAAAEARALPAPSASSIQPYREDESVSAARLRFARLAPASLRRAYARLLAMAKEEGGGTQNAALPVPGGKALDEDAEVAGTPDGAVATLSTLERLVRAAAEDATGGQSQLLEMTCPLLRALLAAGNRFNNPHVPAWRFGGLVALAVCAGPLAADFLLARFAAPSAEVGEGLRLEALDVLVAAARELSAAEPPLRLPPPPWERKDWRPEVVDDVNLGAGAEEEVKEAAMGAGAGAGAEATTPSSSSSSAPPLPNLFAAIAADHVFFPLLRIVLAGSAGAQVGPASSSASASRIDVFGGGVSSNASSPSSSPFGAAPQFLAPGQERLLAQAVQALAVMLEAAGSDPSVPRMARALLPLAWTVRGSTEPLVRRASLSAAAAVIASVHRQMHALLFSPSVLEGAGLDRGPGAAVAGAAPSGGGGGGDGLSSSPLADLTSVGARIAQRDAFGKVAAAIVDPGPRGSLSSVAGKMKGGAGGESSSSSLPPGAGAGEGGPTLWDDLLLVVAWLKATADGDLDPGARALASTMLGNVILREVVLGPLEAVEP
jgi:hypothetical protein